MIKLMRQPAAELTANERVRRCITFQRPDRTPYFRWDRPEISDIVVVLFKPGKHDVSGRTYTDPWGCVWSRPNQVMGQVIEHPIRTLADYESFVLPADDPLNYESIDDTYEAYPDRFRVGASGHFLFERLHLLRGFENALMDLISQEPACLAFLDRLVDYYKSLIDGYASSGKIDAVAFNEDLGLQDKMMLSPSCWRTVLKPRYERIYQHAHEQGLFVFQHSCGYILDILPDLVEIGADIIEMQQLQNMGIAKVAQEVRGRLTITAGVDIQAVLPGQDREEIETFIDELFNELDTPAGGFIAQSYSGCDGLGIGRDTVEFAQSRMQDRLSWRDQGHAVTAAT